jgi:hypothetical protein
MTGCVHRGAITVRWTAGGPTNEASSIDRGEDGTRFPIQVRTTLAISADGTVDVKVDSVTCGGQTIDQ